MVHFLTFQNKCVGMLLMTVFSEADQESLTTTLNYTTSVSDIDLGDFLDFYILHRIIAPAITIGFWVVGTRWSL